MEVCIVYWLLLLMLLLFCETRVRSFWEAEAEADAERYGSERMRFFRIGSNTT